MGIDIVAVDERGAYWAVQCKWRAPAEEGKRRSYISWAQLSTFYALAARTGPYAKHLVLTNASGARHVGARQPEDETVACAGFKHMPRESWARMLPAAEEAPAGAADKKAALDIQAVRAARIKALEGYSKATAP
jgi:predicted helicase